MKTYTASFKGRKNGAIGVFYWITCKVQGENEKQAELNLYKEYEHIQQLTLI